MIIPIVLRIIRRPALKDSPAVLVLKGLTVLVLTAPEDGEVLVLTDITLPPVPKDLPGLVVLVAGEVLEDPTMALPAQASVVLADRMALVVLARYVQQRCF